MKQLWNENWKFMKCSVDTTFEQAMEQKKDMTDVEIPHDWLIYDTNNLYEDSTGWYAKEFEWHEAEGDMLLTFDGVYMNCTIYVNQKEAGQWKYGYSSFTLNVTDYLQEGTNEIVVGVLHQSPNSRWYSGAGIYRNVWMRLVKDVYIEENGLYTHSEACEGGFKLVVETNVVLDRFLALQASQVYKTLATGQKVSEVRDKMETESTCIIEHFLIDKETGMRVPMQELDLYEKKPVLGHIGACSATGSVSDEIKTYGQTFLVANPNLWEPENPSCYELVTRLYRGGLLCDTLSTTIGFKTVVFDADKGFFLNGKHMKLNGVCEHHDLGALGAAFNKPAQRRKYKILKEMGVNAIRFAHNMPAPGCLELCDEMGLLVMDEAFDMWEKPKTPYDYARFFNDWVGRDMESFVRRDRNHVSIIMWSIGNEIPDTHADAKRGKKITSMLKKWVEKYDPYKNAVTTFSSNYLPWDNSQPSADVLDTVGYNYSERYYKAHHEKYPKRIIFGGETSSIVYSRGIYHFPFEANILADDDEQCSAMGNSTTSWSAKSLEALVCEDRDMEFSLGQFLWTGTDYIGEPTPYHTKNSYFGQVDTAGFPKDSYYVMQSAWTDYRKKPMIHVFPYWDFNEGQLIDVRVCSNAPYVELFLNDVSLGKQRLTHEVNSGNHIIANYKIPYKTGTLKAVAYDDAGNVVCTESKHSFKEAVKLVMRADKPYLESEDDIQCITIMAVDEDGHLVENATNRVRVDVSGAGKLIGLDNGDSTDFDSYKGNSKRLFGGKLLAMIQASGEAGSIMFSAKLDEADIPVRKIEISCQAENDTAHDFKEKRVITPGHGVVKAYAKLLPENTSYKDIVWKAVNDTGVEVNLVELQPGETQNEVIVKAVGDGSFRLRCMSKSGDERIYRIISELEMSVEGFGPAYYDPYDFITGSLYSRTNGKEGAGNEKGVATASDCETVITYDYIDFGDTYADEITMPIFALDSDPHEIKIYEGTPDEGKPLGVVVYQKPSIWNVYQEDTWKLDRPLKGVASISFVLNSKIHIKGFSFTKNEKAYLQLRANQAEAIYGDSFVQKDGKVEQIGNNVSLLFTGMDFGCDAGENTADHACEKVTSDGMDRTKAMACTKITIRGRALQADNPIHIRFQRGTEEIKQVVEFPKTADYQEVAFELEPVTGAWDVSFMFMPGSSFDFDWFRFEA